MVVNVIEPANDLVHVKMEILGSLFGHVKLNSSFSSSVSASASAQPLSSNFP